METKATFKEVSIKEINKGQLFKYKGDLYIAKIIGKNLIFAAKQKRDLFGAKPIAIFRFKHNYRVTLIS